MYNIFFGKYTNCQRFVGFCPLNLEHDRTWHGMTAWKHAWTLIPDTRKAATWQHLSDLADLRWTLETVFLHFPELSIKWNWMQRIISMGWRDRNHKDKDQDLCTWLRRLRTLGSKEIASLVSARWEHGSMSTAWAASIFTIVSARLGTLTSWTRFRMVWLWELVP